MSTAVCRQNSVRQQIQAINANAELMIPFFISPLTCLNAFFRSRYNLGLEILALRQQLGILKRKQHHPRLRIQDRMFWILLRRLWPAWSNILIIVKSETVVA